MSKLTIIEYLKNPASWSFLWRNIMLTDIQWVLPGVFTTNPYPNTVNGSLWTIPHEIVCYGFVAVAGIMGLLRLKWIPIVALVTSIAVIQIIFFGNSWVLPSKILGVINLDDFSKLSALFLAGMITYNLSSVLGTKIEIALVAFISYLIASRYGTVELFEPILLPLMIYYLAFSPDIKLNDFGRFGDFSYGLYVYAFPIQQIFAQPTFGTISKSPLVHTFTSLLFTTIIGALSWRYIEAPMLRLKKHRFLTLRWINRFDKPSISSVLLDKITSFVATRPKLKLTLALSFILVLIITPSYKISTNVNFAKQETKYSLQGYWHTSGKGENYRWLYGLGSIFLNKNPGTSELHLQGYVPQSIHESTELNISIFRGEALIKSVSIKRPSQNEAWVIDNRISIAQVADGIIRVSLEFNGVHRAKPEDVDQRPLSGLFSIIEIR